jgi:hypothetical protein
VRVGAVIALALACSWPLPALAAEDASPNAFVRKGAELFKQQDYEGARGAFARAYELDPKATTLFNLALSELNSDHPVEAAKDLREYLTHSEEPAAKLESVRTKWLARAEARTARLEVFAPAGAELVIDGAVQERAAPGGDAKGQPVRASISITVAAGEHDVTARQGSGEESQHVVARGGELVELHFQRLPDAVQPPSTTPVGWLGAESGQEMREGVSTARSRAKWVTVIALGSGAVVAAAFGLGFGIAAQDKANDAGGLHAAPGWTKSECSDASVGSPLCMQLKSDVDANRHYWGIATASTIGAGVLAAASAATWVLWKPKSAALVARPMVGSASAGLFLDGQW